MARVITDETIAALNIWMEARGESYEGKVAVAEVMRNRTKLSRWDLNKDKQITAVEVVLAPYQFSGWNTTDPNRTKALLLDDTDPAYQECVKAWRYVNRTPSDTVRGATLYYNPKVIPVPPAWAKPENKLAVVGNHHFYRE